MTHRPSSRNEHVLLPVSFQVLGSFLEGGSQIKKPWSKVAFSDSPPNTIFSEDGTVKVKPLTDL